jgi:hypothetical protein
MKQLLFLLLFPCLAMAQYPGNGNQKITLGEQSTADGLVYRGVAADTTRKPSVDTMAYILLDTNTNIIWQYKKATNNAWTRVGGSISSGVTGVLPVANGGTGATALTANKFIIGNGTSPLTSISNWNYIPANDGELEFKTGRITFRDAFTKTILFPSGLLIQNFTSDAGIAKDLMSVTDSTTAIEHIKYGFYASGQVFNWGYIGTAYNDTWLQFNANGNVGVKIDSDSPTEALHVVGNARITGLANAANPVNVQVDVNGVLVRTSSIDIKEDVQSLPYGLNEVMLLQPSKFSYIDKYKYGEGYDIGFIAEDVNNVIPEAVGTGVESDVFMDSVKLIPVLTKAIQEQQALIKALEQRILILENK